MGVSDVCLSLLENEFEDLKGSLKVHKNKVSAISNSLSLSYRSLEYYKKTPQAKRIILSMKFIIEIDVRVSFSCGIHRSIDVLMLIHHACTF